MSFPFPAVAAFALLALIGAASGCTLSTHNLANDVRRDFTTMPHIRF